MCVLPAHFPLTAYVFATLCAFTIVTRLATAHRALD